MTLQSSGAISLSQINSELGRSASATIGLQAAEIGSYATINTASTSRPNGSTPSSLSEWYGYNHNAVAAPTPNYWWRADYGLSTSGWTAYNGGVNFTLYGVSSANSTTGLYLGGGSYGLSNQLSSSILAYHIVIRATPTDRNAGHTVLGSSTGNIHEWAFTNIYDNWYVVSYINATLNWAASGGVLGSNWTWHDMTATGFYDPYAGIMYADSTSNANTLSIYYNSTSQWDGAWIWGQTFNYLSLGIRGTSWQGYTAGFQGYIKEIAVFTSPQSYSNILAFVNSMNARWS